MAEIKPGILCKVIGSALGPKGSSVGAIVRVVGQDGGPPHSLHGDIWRCELVKGTNLVTEYGGIGREADFAEDWLEPLPPTTAPLKKESLETNT